MAKLAAMDRTMYEEAFYALVQYNFAGAWGTPAEQLAALTRASFIDRSRGFLPDGQLVTVLRAKLGLQLMLNHHARALVTIEQLRERSPAPEDAERYTAFEARIFELRDAPELRMEVAGTVGRSNQTVHHLLRNTVQLEDVQGDIAELRLHCDKAFVGFIYQEELAYTVNDNYRDCRVIIVGNPGTTFKLVEL